MGTPLIKINIFQQLIAQFLVFEKLKGINLNRGAPILWGFPNKNTMSCTAIYTYMYK